MSKAEHTYFLPAVEKKEFILIDRNGMTCEYYVTATVAIRYRTLSKRSQSLASVICGLALQSKTSVPQFTKARTLFAKVQNQLDCLKWMIACNADQS